MALFGSGTNVTLMYTPAKSGVLARAGAAGATATAAQGLAHPHARRGRPSVQWSGATHGRACGANQAARAWPASMPAPPLRWTYPLQSALSTEELETFGNLVRQVSPSAVLVLS